MLRLILLNPGNAPRCSHHRRNKQQKSIKRLNRLHPFISVFRSYFITMSTDGCNLHNGTLPERECLLQKLDDEFIELQIPVMVILGFLGLVGLIGNPFVLVFYSRKRNKTVFSTFIQTLCIADLAICCLSVPIEIMDIRFNYTFDSTFACKLVKHVNYAAVLISCGTLMSIAFYRFRMLCKPFEIPISLTKARILCASLISIAFVITTPVPIIYTNVKFNVTNEFYDDLEGRDCTVDWDNWFVLTVVSGSLLLSLFIVAFIILAVLYSKMGCFYYNHRKKNVLRRKPPQNVPCAESSDSSRINNDTPVSKDEADEEALQGGISRCASMDVVTQSEDIQFEQEGRQQKVDKKSVKFTLLMFILTCMFFLSFVPYMIVLIWYFVGNPFGDQHYGTWGNLLGRSWVLNSAVNPILYGCFNSDLRKFVGKIVLPCVYK